MGRGGGLWVVLTPSPGTVAVVPYFAVVDGLAAHGVSGMDIGTILHQHLHAAQQALTGCQVEGCGAIACLTVEGREEGRKEGQGPSAHQRGGQTSFQVCSAPSALVTLKCPLSSPSFNFLNRRRRVWTK